MTFLRTPSCSQSCLYSLMSVVQKVIHSRFPGQLEFVSRHEASRATKTPVTRQVVYELIDSADQTDIGVWFWRRTQSRWRVSSDPGSPRRGRGARTEEELVTRCRRRRLDAGAPHWLVLPERRRSHAAVVFLPDFQLMESEEPVYTGNNVLGLTGTP